MSTEENNDIKVLELRVKKLTRALEKQRMLNERNKVTFEAKRQFADIVLAERSHLERNMSLMLHHSANMLLFFDDQGIIDFCADLFLEFKGLTSFSQIEGQTLRTVTKSFLPTEYVDEIEALLVRTLSADSETLGDTENALRRKFQAYSHIEHEIRDYTAQAVLLIDENNKKDGLLIQLYDTTEYLRSQRAAEQASKAKSDFLATVSHEIRTPMTAIIGLTDMMLTTQLDEKQLDCLDKIRASSVSMLELINDILDFSKIEAEKFGVLHECFDLVMLLNNIESMFEVMMAQRNLQFITRFDSNLPETVWSDEKRVRQILTNILDNACKYTPSGSVVFSATAEGNDVVRFDVTDTGIGIKESDIGFLFTEFEQLDMVRNKHVAGTGLGLAITKRLVEMLNGSVQVHSEYGVGSTFTVRLPFTPASRDELPAPFDESITFTAPDAKVLIVDDVEVNIEIAQFMLEPYQVSTQKAYDGLQAVQMVSEQHFDLVLMDQMMPNMDGIEATRTIRHLEGAASQVPVVALTANAVQGMEAKFIEAGFDGFISKPIDATQLASTLYRLLPSSLVKV